MRPSASYPALRPAVDFALHHNVAVVAAAAKTLRGLATRWRAAVIHHLASLVLRLRQAVERPQT